MSFVVSLAYHKVVVSQAYNMKPKKSLGQHFLKCDWVISILLKAAELKSGDVVLEIGPGTGVLTRALAKHAQKVIAVEKDEKLAEALEESLKKEEVRNVKIIKGDILKILPDSKPLTNKQRFKVVANIPYYLTSRLLRILLEKGPRPNLIALTIQKEVAERISAKPPRMNLLALSVQAFSRPKIIKAVPASCFWPKPKVDSAIIKITNLSENFFIRNGLDAEKFFQIAKTAFGQKRKLLTGSLAKIVNKEQLGQVLKEAKINLRARPEELNLDQWLKIVLGIEKLRVKP